MLNRPDRCALGCGVASENHHALHRARRPDLTEREHPLLPLCREAHSAHHDARRIIELIDAETGEVLTEPPEGRCVIRVTDVQRGAVSERPWPPLDVALVSDDDGIGVLDELQTFLSTASDDSLEHTFRAGDAMNWTVGLVQRGIAYEMRKRSRAINTKWADDVGPMLGRSPQTIREWARTWDGGSAAGKAPPELHGLQPSLLDRIAHKPDPARAFEVAEDLVGMPVDKIEEAIDAELGIEPHEHRYVCRCGATLEE